MEGFLFLAFLYTLLSVVMQCVLSDNFLVGGYDYTYHPEFPLLFFLFWPLILTILLVFTFLTVIFLPGREEEC